MNRLINWLWSLLPDHCEMPGCCRKGVRGNENLVNLGGEIRVMCDYCSVKNQRAEAKGETV